MLYGVLTRSESQYYLFSAETSEQQERYHISLAPFFSEMEMLVNNINEIQGRHYMLVRTVPIIDETPTVYRMQTGWWHQLGKPRAVSCFWVFYFQGGNIFIRPARDEQDAARDGPICVA